jgi:HAMP domain-containing protein
MIGLAIVVAGASLLIGLRVAYLLRAAPTVWLQLAGLALVSVCVPLVAVFASGWAMFHMGADTKILAVAACSATAAVGAGLLLARWTSQSIERVSAASARLAAGDLTARAPAGGARELAGLADSFNAMASSIEQLFDRAPRARRLGEPRPEDTACLDAGDDRSDRGRAGRAGRLPADPARAGPARSPSSSTTCSSSRGSTPAR